MKKILLLLTLSISVLCFSSIVFATATPIPRTSITRTPNMMNQTTNTAGNVVNDIGQGIGGVINGAGNALNSVGNATRNVGNDLGEGINRMGNNYDATRTAVDTTANTTWTWVVIAIAVAAIVALIWYYNSENNREARKRDRY